MNGMKKLLAAIGILALSAFAFAQEGPAMGPVGGLDPARILKPLAEDWPTYSGDYSGKRYSKLTQINQSNVKNLALAWTARFTNGGGQAGGGGGRGGFGGPPLIVGGEGTAEAGFTGNTTIRASILQVDGILYLSTPDN